MSDIERIEISRYRREISDDIEHLVNKYSRIMGWEVPDLDEQAARNLIFQALKESLAEVEGK
ncbi:MAG: hypothetical protein U9Q81_04740 [Pseudomonadota bacterium]|nr:hypothetical protein [Pseudomonadota bacterium]